MTRPAFVYLASQSPRRQQLLQQLGVRCELLLPDADEDAEALEALRPGDTAETYVRRVTRAKLDAARQRLQRRGLPEAPVLAADTTVAIGRAILGKPADAAEARAMLQRLSGRWHRVLSGVAVSHGPRNAGQQGTRQQDARQQDPRRALGHERSTLALQVSRVRMAVLPRAVIDAYVASGEPFGKAGAYAIQSAIAGWIERIDGSHSGIMGLPLHETAQLLQRAGVPTALTP